MYATGKIDCVTCAAMEIVEYRCCISLLKSIQICLNRMQIKSLTLHIFVFFCSISFKLVSKGCNLAPIERFTNFLILLILASFVSWQAISFAILAYYAGKCDPLRSKQTTQHKKRMFFKSYSHLKK